MLGSALVSSWRTSHTLSVLVRSHRITDPAVANVVVDLASGQGVAAAVERTRPELVVHCAALTNVDECEKDPARAHAINVEATRVLAAAAREARARFVYVSTDAIFSSGDGPHDESAEPMPLSAYARTKLAGESAALTANPDTLVVRTCIYGWSATQTRPSLAEWILAELGAGRTITGFTDLFFTPILANHLVVALDALIERGERGIFHVGGRDCTSKHDFAVALAAEFGLPASLIRRGESSSMPGLAPRPRRPCLDSARYSAATGRPVPRLEEGIRELRRLDESGWRMALRDLVEPHPGGLR